MQAVWICLLIASLIASAAIVIYVFGKAVGLVNSIVKMLPY